MHNDAYNYDSQAQAAHSSGFLYGVLLGSLVGASLALLFAPKAGSELRTDLADATSRIRRRAGEAYGEASTMMNDMVEKGRSAVRRGRQGATDQTASSSYADATGDAH